VAELTHERLRLTRRIELRGRLEPLGAGFVLPEAAFVARLLSQLGRLLDGDGDRRRELGRG
jgi:hypothetical protein